MRWSFPAVDFPLYGLPSDRDLMRWPDHVDGRVGEPAVGLWQWHGRQPVPSPAERPEGCLQRAVDLAERQADRYPQWEEVAWTVDRRPVPARVLGWAGAWAGFTTAVPEVDIVAVGAVVEPSALVLEELADTSAYHFERSRPLELPEVLETASGRALPPTQGETEQVVSHWPRHPDHDRLGQ